MNAVSKSSIIYLNKFERFVNKRCPAPPHREIKRSSIFPSGLSSFENRGSLFFKGPLPFFAVLAPETLIAKVIHLFDDFRIEALVSKNQIHDFLSGG